MPGTTFLHEEIQQCEAFLAVLDEAGCPGLIPPGQTALEAWVLLRPALQALRVPRLNQRWMEAEVRDDPAHYPWVLFVHPETQRRYLYVQLSPFVMLAGYRGRHPVCFQYQVWHTGVTSALMKHGWYDPTTGHTPPPGEELKALERREQGRDLFNNLMPGFGDALSGHLPQTEEGRRNIWYLAVDEDGQQTLINGADMPTDADEEEDDYL